MSGSGKKLADLIERYGDRCVYCGKMATTRDHLLPRSRGGSNAMHNLRPCCTECNQAKANMTPKEWKGKMCPKEFAHIVPPTPIRLNKRVPLTYEPFSMIVACASCGYVHSKPKDKCSNCGAYSC